MQRRTFLQLAAASALAPAWAQAQSLAAMDLRRAVVILGPAPSARERKAAQVLIEEAAKRCGITWPLAASALAGQTGIYLTTRHSAQEWARPDLAPAAALAGLRPEGFLLRSGRDTAGAWIAITGADERGLLFGVGKLLRLLDFDRQQVALPAAPLDLLSNPQYRLRGHQLGYRPKNNAYDAWSTPMWDQYLRDLAVMGTNAIELIPPISDDLPDSPQFPLPPAQMMVEMSRLADSYGLDVWIWYPALAHDYSMPATVAAAVQEWGQVFSMLPRVDAVFVPGGDPGHTAPRELLALLERQKANLRQHHPRAQMWVSPQGFNASWMQEFLEAVRLQSTQQWLDGVVVGPGCRMSAAELRQALPSRYPIRFYPDITHSLSCQFPVADWDVAYALTEGREVINPRPRAEANIVRRSLPGTEGFIAYSEGCNDDVNKCVWSALAWDPHQPAADVLRDYARYFFGAAQAEGLAQGLLQLEENWRGALVANSGVEVTLERFQDLERHAAPALLRNWRFQMALYRAYADAFVRHRLLEETAQLERARDVLAPLFTIGWGAVPLGVGSPPATTPPNGLDPEPLLAHAQARLKAPALHPAAAVLRTRVSELGAMLFQSIGMQLAVELYQGEAVGRGANLDTLDTPVSDAPWLRRQIAAIRQMPDPMAQIAALRAVLFRTDPGPGGFYDQLGDTAQRPHLELGQGEQADPAFRHTALLGFRYPDTLRDTAPLAWKRWAGSLYDAPLVMRYHDLDRRLTYRLRVVYAGDRPQAKLRLVANDMVEIHPFLPRAWPPAPQEFTIPKEATATGELKLAWTQEPGQGGDGRGCQVAEVWLQPMELNNEP